MWNIDHSDRGSITGIQKALQGRRRMLWRRRRCEDQAEALRHYRSDQKLHIEGMSCVNCRNRIENALNGMAQVNAKASFKKGEAVVKLGADVPEEELCEAVEKLGYKVTSIELM